MIIAIPQLLTSPQVQEIRAALDAAAWIDGKATAGHQSARVKNNQQLQEDSPTARRLADIVLAALEKNSLFFSAALPAKIFPPLFNRYLPGNSFGVHVDNAVRQIKGTAHRVRTDLSATVFLSGPEEYEGGELMIEDNYGPHSVKLQAGDMVLYPASSLHKVQGISRGARLASFFWIQSMVRDDSQRTLLFDLDTAIRKLNADVREPGPDNGAIVQLTGIYHNLLRSWAEI